MLGSSQGCLLSNKAMRTWLQFAMYFRSQLLKTLKTQRVLRPNGKAHPKAGWVKLGPKCGTSLLRMRRFGTPMCTSGTTRSAACSSTSTPLGLIQGVVMVRCYLLCMWRHLLCVRADFLHQYQCFVFRSATHRYLSTVSGVGTSERAASV
jgi:hypothetical protein